MTGRLEDLARQIGDRSDRFGVRVPLRICPVGAHVDHQSGVVTGMTVDRSIDMVVAPRHDRRMCLRSEGFEGSVEFPVDSAPAPKQGDWGDYPRAALSVLRDSFRLERGLDVRISGELAGTGLSSSAAVVVGYLMALARVNGLSIPAHDMVTLAQRAENQYVGLAIGILDPSIILFSRAGTLTRVDCRDRALSWIGPSDAVDFAVLVAFSGVRRALAGSAYNDRVAECRQAAQILLEQGGVEAEEAVLRAVPSSVFEEFGPALPSGPHKRAAHFFAEMARVEEACDAFQRGDIEAVGACMTASGESSITNFETGTEALICLHELLRDSEGVYGTRFSGAGFGGSCVALVEPEAADAIIERVESGYRAVHPEHAAGADFHLCRPSGAAEIVEL